MVNKTHKTKIYNLQETFDNIYNKSKNNINLANCFDIIISKENIKLAFECIKSNTGSKTKGTDNLTVNDFKNYSEDYVINLVKNSLKNYKPSRIKKVEIPKKDGSKRPLGIPTFKDRLIQQCFLQVLEPFFEAKFSNRSHGFRPNRSPETAMAQVHYAINRQKLYYAVNVDIKKFFDNVNHQLLIKKLWNNGLRDKKVLKILKLMLKSDIEHDGKITKSEKGTPQGGILSPLLSNIFLNELDVWIDSQWRNFKTSHDYTQRSKTNNTIINSSKYRALRKTNLKEMFITRYADDFVIFTNSYSKAQKIKHATEQWLENNLKLKINKNKSKVIDTRRNKLEYLGFDIKAVKKHNKFTVKSHIPKETIKIVHEKLKNKIHEVKKSSDTSDIISRINSYNSIVMGFQNYYSMATMCSKDVAKTQWIINKIWHNSYKEGYTNKGKIVSKPIKDRYGKSKQVRYLSSMYILPIGYVKNRIPKHKNNKTNKYTKEGRTPYKVANPNIVNYLLMNQNKQRTIEFNNNKVNAYVQQKGKCKILKKDLNINEIECHHIKPTQLGGTDEYKNLIIIHKDIHKLIHLKDIVKIKQIIDKHTLKIDEIQIINKYREIANNYNLDEEVLCNLNR